MRRVAKRKRSLRPAPGHRRRAGTRLSRYERRRAGCGCGRNGLCRQGWESADRAGPKFPMRSWNRIPTAAALDVILLCSPSRTRVSSARCGPQDRSGLRGGSWPACPTGALSARSADDRAAANRRHRAGGSIDGENKASENGDRNARWSWKSDVQSLKAAWQKPLAW